MNTQKFESLMYALIKNAARNSFVDFLEQWNISEEEYDEISAYLTKTYGIDMYL